MKTSTVVALVAVAAAAFFLVMRRRAVAPSPLNLGMVGGAAHSPDVTTGGIASVLGAALPSLTSWFGGTSSAPASSPADKYSPYLGNSTVSNPVYPSPSVLPYSYKQQNTDTASFLDTNSLFTPSPVTGSSGSYSDDSDYGFSDGTDYGF